MKAGAVAALLTLAACSSSAPTVIDGSDPGRIAESVAQARGDLPVADPLDFDRALATAPTRRFGAEDGEALKRLSFDDMTAEQVVAD